MKHINMKDLSLKQVIEALENSGYCFDNNEAPISSEYKGQATDYDYRYKIEYVHEQEIKACSIYVRHEVYSDRLVAEF